MSTSYQYVSPELRVFCGGECLGALKRELVRSGCSRVVIVSGRTIGRSREMAELRDGLGATCVGLSTSAREHSPASGVEEAARYLEDIGADGILAVGGGSAAVTARAASILLGEKRPLAELCTRRLADGRFESPRLNAPKLPVFGLPTTPSTAFSKAGTAVHDADGQRLALFDPKTRARAIFIHPDFLQTAPEDLVQSAALNALSNTVEALESPQCDLFSEAFLMQALRLLRDGLDPKARNAASRERLVVAAILSGRGTEAVGTGLASVLAHAIGKRTHVANGIVNGIVLPQTMRYNAPVTQVRSGAVLEALAGLAGAPRDQSPSKLVETLLGRLPLPKTLREIGVGMGDLSDIADSAMSDWFITKNARPVKDKDTLMELLTAAW